MTASPIEQGTRARPSLIQPPRRLHVNPLSQPSAGSCSLLLENDFPSAGERRFYEVPFLAPAPASNLRAARCRLGISMPWTSGEINRPPPPRFRPPAIVVMWRGAFRPAARNGHLNYTPVFGAAKASRTNCASVRSSLHCAGLLQRLTGCAIGHQATLIVLLFCSIPHRDWRGQRVSFIGRL